MKKHYLLSCLAVLVILMVVLLFGGYLYMVANAAAQSVVLIRAPHEGDNLPAGQPVWVRALARDDSKITRIEFWVDGQLIDAQASSTQSGIDPFPLLTSWYPEAGLHTLTVRAFNSRGGTSQSSINVKAEVFPDRDMDGATDEVDACPDQAGNPMADGCPDLDFDGIPDTLDACPDEAGLPETGCPVPGEGDRDGDGLLDGADACPDAAGSPLADGCPDADGDGTGEPFDACPAEPGGGEDGCPDAGLSEPEPGGAFPEPLPGEDPPDPADDDAPEPGGVGDMEFDLGAPTDLEIEAYELYLSAAYERVWCYVRLGEEDPRRYEFDALGEQYWDIAAELGGENSVRILHPAHQPLQLSVECLGSNPGSSPVNTGVITATHLPSDWDGRELQASSTDAFVRYRICSPSCDESAFPAPLLAPVTTGPIGEGPYTLGWRWSGDPESIDGFGLVISTGDDYAALDIPNPNLRSLDIADYIPACGESTHFRIYAYQSAGDVRSPVSNEQHWPGAPCTFTANVTFTTLDVHNPPADEDGLHRPGPIYGEFWVSNGTTIEALNFNACWCYVGPGMTLWGWCEGLVLPQGSYAINRGIFDWINTTIASCIGDGCHSNSFYAPSSSSLSLPLDDGDDITIGGRIMDCDERANAHDVLYQEQESITISIDELDHLTEPIWRTLSGEHVNLNYFIRMGR